jgi:hypothetical protein
MGRKRNIKPIVKDRICEMLAEGNSCAQVREQLKKDRVEISESSIYKIWEDPIYAAKIDLLVRSKFQKLTPKAMRVWDTMLDAGNRESFLIAKEILKNQQIITEKEEEHKDLGPVKIKFSRTNLNSIKPDDPEAIKNGETPEIPNKPKPDEQIPPVAKTA